MNTSFSDLYRRYAGDVHRFALCLSGSSSDADDITAETFARAYTAGDIRIGTVKAYLFTIARNVYLSGKARSARSQEIDETIPDRREGPEQQVAIHEETDMLLRALKRLPEQDRAALLMRGHEEMSHEEIAGALGVSVVVVKVRIHRARLRLAGLMVQLSGGSHAECNA